ncbi:MAG: hypothetical protein ACXWQQ_02065 [Pseudobdellovibrio sp.]
MKLTNAKPTSFRFINSNQMAFKLKGLSEEGKEVIIEPSFSLFGKGFFAFTLKFMHHALGADKDGWVDFEKIGEVELNITATEKIVNDRKYITITY